MEGYGRRVILNVPFERGLSRTVKALQEEGFETITRLDVRETLRHTLGQDFRRHVILGVSHPGLMLKALRQELDAGTILPVNVAVYELADGETAVTVGEPFAPLTSDRQWREERPDLWSLAIETEDRLATALDELAGKHRAGAALAAAC